VTLSAGLAVLGDVGRVVLREDGPARLRAEVFDRGEAGTCRSSMVEVISSIRRASSATTVGADSTSSLPSRHKNRGARPIPVLRTLVAREAAWLYWRAGFWVSSR